MLSRWSDWTRASTHWSSFVAWIIKLEDRGSSVSNWRSDRVSSRPLTMWPRWSIPGHIAVIESTLHHLSPPKKQGAFLSRNKHYNALISALFYDTNLVSKNGFAKIIFNLIGSQGHECHPSPLSPAYVILPLQRLCPSNFSHRLDQHYKIHDSKAKTTTKS